MKHLAIFALGPLRIELDGEPLQTSRHKALALLVYLAMQPGKHSRAVLSALLWPDYDQEKAYAYLRRTLWEINNILGEGWLEADREEIGFSPKTGFLLDVTEFQSHLEVFQQQDHPVSAADPECIAALHIAALLYRGDFLAGLSLRDSVNFEDWQFFQSEALRRDYANALQKLVMLLCMKNAFDEATVFAHRWLALDNLNEEALREVMRIHALNGQRNIALRQYQECCRLLHAELGVIPEQATTALYEQILSGGLGRAGEAKNTPGINTQTGTSASSLGERLSSKEIIPAGILQSPSRPFIGRLQELKQITALLADPDCWLLTLLGPGGIGKTRLSIEVGLKQQGIFSQAVFFIPLNAVESGQSVAPAIARATGLILRQNGPSPEEQLLDFLREKQLLLILDSFEALVQSAELLGKIHAHAKGIKMLVTSRHRLPLQGAWVVEVKGLDFPQKQPNNMEELQSYSAVELFLQAARRAGVDFRIAEMDHASIARITQLLEGMPLGLELAATWIKMLSFQEIADEINRNLDFLETSLQDLPERQRSIRAVFDYSWNLLDSREQRVFPRLAVFPGSFTRQAAQQVVGISLRELSVLVDKSLVQRTPDGRFVLHDLLRQYSLEILDRLPADCQETHDRHCAFFCSRLSEWNSALGSTRQGQALREVEADLENAQVAWGWAASQGQIERLDQATDGLCMFFLRRARFLEGLTTCEKAGMTIRDVLNMEGRRLRAHLFIWQAVFKINIEEFEEAGQFLRASESILDHLGIDPQKVYPERIFQLITQAILANLQHDPTATVRFYKQSFYLSQKATGKITRWYVFFWRFLMGGSVSPELYCQLEQDLEAVRAAGDPFELGCHLFVLGIAEAFHYFRVEKAEPLLKESCEIFQTLDDPVSQVMIFNILSYLFYFQGKYDENLVLKYRELAIYEELGDRRMIGIAHVEVGGSLYHLGKYAEAEDQIRIGLALVQGRSDYEYALQHRALGDVLLVQGKYLEALEAYQFNLRFFQSVNEKGWMITALTGLSRTELALGNRSKAWLHAYQALQLYSEVKLFTFFVYLTLAETALLLLDEGELFRAFELYNLVVQQAYLANSRWFADLYGRSFEEAAARLTLEEQAAVQECAKAQNFIGTVESILNNPRNIDP